MQPCNKQTTPDFFSLCRERCLSLTSWKYLTSGHIKVGCYQIVSILHTKHLCTVNIFCFSFQKKIIHSIVSESMTFKVYYVFFSFVLTLFWLQYLTERKGIMPQSSNLVDTCILTSSFSLVPFTANLHGQTLPSPSALPMGQEHS